MTRQVFSLAFTAAHTMLCGMKYTHSMLLSIALLLVGVPALMSRQLEFEKRMSNLFTVSVLVISSHLMSTVFNDVVRAQFRLQCVFQFEKRRTRDILLNLLPDDIAKRMVRSSSRLSADVRRAVVLQLDLCNFTQFSQSVQPSELAVVMHRIFSQFDQALHSHGKEMHKLDTVGDAYVAAAFLPGMQWVDGPDEELRRVCRKMRLLAGQMHRILADLRADTGYPLHARIGIGIGDVAAGVMGRLQPRFHLMGPARDSAEAHEKLAPVDGILLSEPLYLLMRGFGEEQDEDESSSDDATSSCSDCSDTIGTHGEGQAKLGRRDRSEELTKLDELSKDLATLKAPGVEPEDLAERFRLSQKQEGKIYRRRFSGSKQNLISHTSQSHSSEQFSLQKPPNQGSSGDSSDLPRCNQAESAAHDLDREETRGGEDKDKLHGSWEWMQVSVVFVQITSARSQL
jgi:class 3 adenylate cyclase